MTLGDHASPCGRRHGAKGAELDVKTGGRYGVTDLGPRAEDSLPRS